jgi:hypothetical protein
MKNKDQILLEDLCTKIFQESAKEDWDMLLKMNPEELDIFLRKQGMNSMDVADMKNKLLKYRKTKANPFDMSFDPRSGGKIFHVKKLAKTIKRSPKEMRAIDAYVQRLKAKYNQ